MPRSHAPGPRIDALEPRLFLNAPAPGPGPLEDPAHPAGGAGRIEMDAGLADVESLAEAASGGAGLSFTQRLVYPEGFAGFQKREILSLMETTGFLTHYQVVIRYEFGERDAVVAEGSLAPHERLDIMLSDWFDAAPELVRVNEPYSIELHAVADAGALAVVPPAEPLAAALTRQDGYFRFDAPLTPGDAVPQTGETLFSLANLESEDLMTWGFGEIPFGSQAMSNRAFVTTLTQQQSAITLHNLSGEDAEITMTLFVRAAGGRVEPLVEMFTLGAMRRGGRAMASIDLPEHFHSIEGALIHSTQPIVAQLSVYHQQIVRELGGAMHSHERGAWAVKGTPGGGAISGALAQIGVPDMFPISVFNPNAVPISLFLRFVRADGTVEEKFLTVGAHDDFEVGYLPNPPLAPGERFVAVSHSAAAPVIVHHARTVEGRDRGVTSAERAPATRLGFAWGQRVEPGGQHPEGAPAEVISVFDPNFRAGGNAVRLQFHFNDGSRIDRAELALSAGGRLDLTLDDPALSEVLAKVNSGAAFQTYSITIEATRRPIFAWLRRVDDFGGSSTTMAGQPLWDGRVL